MNDNKPMGRYERAAKMAEILRQLPVSIRHNDSFYTINMFSDGERAIARYVCKATNDVALESKTESGHLCDVLEELLQRYQELRFERHYVLKHKTPPNE